MKIKGYAVIGAEASYISGGDRPSTESIARFASTEVRRPEVKSYLPPVPEVVLAFASYMARNTSAA